MKPNRDIILSDEKGGVVDDGGNDPGKRYNKGKLRYDLVPARAQEEYVRVLTKGSEKYAARNWERGMSWSGIMASLKRHIAEWEKGEDFDEETGLPHIAHAMCNAAFLVEFMHTHPEFDDRPHLYLTRPKIGLDIDEVLADWVGTWTSKFNQELPSSWRFDREIMKKFDEMKNDKEFWLGLPLKTKPEDLPFEPHCYITSRCIPKEWSEEWLDNNGFPVAEVHAVPFGESKVQVAKDSGIDIFVDDKFDNFIELNEAGICTFLFDAPHNQRYNVGHKRIKDFSRFK